MFLLFLNVFIMGGPGAGPPGICTRLSASGEPRADARTKTVHSFGDPGNRSLVKGENGNGRQKNSARFTSPLSRGWRVQEAASGKKAPMARAGFRLERWTRPSRRHGICADTAPGEKSPEHRECHARQGWDTIHSIFPSVRKLWTGFGKMKWSPFFKGKLLSPTVTLPLPPMTLTRR